jgi:hypothetical protein
MIAMERIVQVKIDVTNKLNRHFVRYIEPDLIRIL